VFFTSKILVKINRVSRKISYNQNPVNMLWTVRHEWPAGAIFAFNCYNHHSLLIVRNPDGMPTCMFSREGVTQGHPIAMFCYGIGILPMVRQLKAIYPELKQPW
jgi:hypothetical protein